MRHRRGFTITELLVAMALIIFIMYILAEVFSAGTAAFRNLKAVGDMNEKLRTTTTLLRRYLSADHFSGRKRLSDVDFWSDTGGNFGPPAEGFFRIWQGSDSTNEGTDLDGLPSYRAVNHGLHFTVKLRGNNRQDFFRAVLPANSPLLRPLGAPALPGGSHFQETTANTYTAPWAEVAVFLKNYGEMTDDPATNTTPQQLYTLHLRQRLLIPDNGLLPAAGQPGSILAAAYNAGSYVEMSCYRDPLLLPMGVPPNLYFNNPADVTMPARRMTSTATWNPGQFGAGPATGQPVSTVINDLTTNVNTQWCGPFPPSNYPTLATEPQARYGGSDVVLNNVLSMEIRVLVAPDAWQAWYKNPNNNTLTRAHDFVTLFDPAVQQFNMNNSGFGYSGPTGVGVNGQALPQTRGGPAVFDTWSGTKDSSYDYTNWSTRNDYITVPMYQTNANVRYPGNVATGQPLPSQLSIRILAIQITLRIWDTQTRQTRQTSIIVDM
jgi:type II secretory pathway pseudopilin PulG